MDAAAIGAEVRAAIAEQFSVPVERITDATTALDVPGWDSLANGLLLMELESRLGRELPIELLTDSQDVGRLTAALVALAS